ncbi:MAG: hypothetical protein OEP48_13975 [Betaproteobacteria bacterium]|nr:hypothetical protein [Betaproteobacteria bacterium]MDH3438363.1 hypothetical protein [Betaproteobacteria bacterium]
MKNAVSGLGLAPDAAMVTFPIELFLPGSDIASVRARKREFYDGLTRWKSEFAGAAPGEKPLLSVEAASHEEALFKANNLLLTSLWGDGLPLWPATRTRVDWILKGSVLPRTHVLGKFPPRGGVTTIETCAIALAMAGGRPEYLPVLVAAVDACLDTESGFDQLQATSGGPFPAVIVNGPIRKQIRLNSGFGCLGPDPQHPAGASIGRALRLLQQNVGGALPGTGTMAIFGAMRYTNAVFGEDEDGLPPGWLPHAAERHGFASGSDSISLVFASGVTNIRRRGAKKETPEEDILNGLHRMADFMRTPNLAALAGYEKGTPGIMMIPPVVAQTMAGLGWTKPSVREFLWEHSRIPLEQMRRAGAPAWIEIDANPVTRASIDLDPWPICTKPDNIVFLVAGGSHPTHSQWLQAHSPRVTGRMITLPESFDRLLADADRDLGCGDDVCLV